MEAIEINKLNPEFKHEVSEHPGGDGIKACFACGACTGGCPASEADPAYDPRKIIRMILLGMKERCCLPTSSGCAACAIPAPSTARRMCSS